MSRHILAATAFTTLWLLGVYRAEAYDRGPAYVAAAAVGQSPASENSAREQMTDLLSRARQSMAEGNLETADSLISRAEGLNVTIGVFHMGDSPKKARRDWQRLREVRGGTTVVDPFAAATATAVPPAATAPMPTMQPLGSPGTAIAQSPVTGAPSSSYPTTQTGAEPLTPFARPLVSNPPTDDPMGRFRNMTGGPNAAPQNAAPYAAAPQAAAAPQRLADTSGVAPLPPTSDNRYAQNPGEVQLVGAVAPLAAAQPTNYDAAAPARSNKDAVLDLVQRARAALASGNVPEAERLAAEAAAYGLGDAEFGPGDDRPWLVLMDVQKVRRRGLVEPAAVTTPTPGFPGVQAVYDSGNDTTRNIAASNQVEGQVAPGALPIPPGQAVPATAVEPIGPGSPGNGFLDSAAQAQDLMARQLQAEISKLEAQAEQVQGADPSQAQALLQQGRVLVEKSNVSTQAKQILLRRIDRDLAKLDEFVEMNRPKIELAQRNREVKDVLDREQMAKLDMQERLAKLIDEYNMLIDQQRFAEAEVLAKRASEIGPNEPIVVQLQAQSKALRRMFNNAEIRGLMENGVINALTSIDRSAIPFDDSRPMQFPQNWGELTKVRGSLVTDGARRSPKELEIEQRLKMPVSLKFENATLAQVFEKLSVMTGVPIYIDQRGLAAEGVDSSTPVSIDLTSEIQLKSALNILLQEHHLTYVVKDEVLKITSDRMRSEDVFTVTYPVGDLVIPIPNFTPSNRMGLSGALHDAQSAIMNGGGGGMGLAAHAPISVMASNGGGLTNNGVLSQVNVPFSGGGGPPVSGSPQNIGFGPGGMGGGVQPDFDSLIELITSTIRQQDWQDNGGTIGFIKSHDTTLSLVITHDVRGHEEIENLLTQLRKLQDLQVTIEVRFITLNDSFYEQVGVDFDLKIDDKTDVPFQVFGRPNPNVSTAYTDPSALLIGAGNPGRDVQDRDGGRSVTVGMSAPGVFSSDLDIPFNNTSFGQTGAAITTAVPTAVVSNGIAAGGASVGFAILSDLEAYFFINAVQDDQRSNILQAPKVTMFNGQQAFVSDTQQVPFVVSVVPVVGDFAAAQQPVIVVLNEGTSLSVQAVVSNDRRFVRMTMVPFFSQIGQVNTFTFEGSQSSTRTTSSATQGPGNESEDEEETVSRSGTTVQLPTFAFQTVTTTVSVPDGGTVLLGGIKRMREARFENGVPLLNKIPYINRLFSNVSIGKSSTSLMMMVTPRIIIQEEEEAAIGVMSAP